MMKPLHLLGYSAAMSALLIFAASEVSAQRGGGRGGGGGGRQVRSSASGSISGARNRPANQPANRQGNRQGNRTINNSGNINTGDINIDIDHDHGWGDIDHPIAAGAAIAATRAVVVGAYYSSLPSGCMKVIENGVSYYTCNGYWYQPIYSGSTVQYVVVNQP